jgi:hypothetical protein
MARTSGDTLSLSNLQGATGAAAKSLSSAAGTTTGPIAMSEFSIGSVDSISGYTYVKESTSETFTLGFTDAGSRFLSRVGSVSNNFSWSIDASSEFSFQANPPYNPSVTAAAIGGGATLAAPTARTIGVKFADGFNDHATGYNVNKTKTVYNVDDYAGASGLCLHLDEDILLADGTTKKAGDLIEGDILKSYYPPYADQLTDYNFYDWQYKTPGGVLTDSVVTGVAYTFVDRWNIVTTDSGSVKGNGEHPMFVWDVNEEVYKFKPLGLIQAGDKFIKVLGDNQVEEVVVLENNVQNSTIEVVSIDVEEVDTYIVNGFVTHNKGSNSFAGYSISAAPTVSISTVTIGGETYKRVTISLNSAVVSPGSTAISANYSFDIQIASDSGFGTILDAPTSFSGTTYDYKTGAAIYARAKTNFAGLVTSYGSSATG